MSLKFDRTVIPGEHGPLVFGAPEIQTRPVKFFQVRGEGEVIGKSGGRWISVRVLLHNNFTTEDKLRAFLSGLSSLVDLNGTITEAGNINRTLDYCTFYGWEPIPLNGQEDPGPLYDFAATLESQPSWFQHVLLRWRQLRTD